MEQLALDPSELPFVQFVAASLKEEGFVLVDVGAGDGGIAPIWKSFGDKLIGFGFDTNSEEMERVDRIVPQGCVEQHGQVPDHEVRRPER